MTSGPTVSAGTGENDLEAAPPPPSSYLDALLESLPAAILVTDGSGLIRYAAGQLDRLGGGSYAELLGTEVAANMAAPEREHLEQLILAAAAGGDGEMAGPLRLSYRGGEGGDIATEVWAVNRTGDASVSGVVLLLLPESAYGRFDRALALLFDREVPVEQAYAALALALRSPPVGAEAYFLVPGDDDRGTVRNPDLEQVPGPPLAGPWDEVLAGASHSKSDGLSELSEPLAQAATAAGFGAVTGGCGAPAAPACLVVWQRGESELSPPARVAVERAVALATVVRAQRLVQEGLREPDLQDPLTGLGNERSLSESLEGHVQAGEQPAMLYFDLAGFQKVNDDLGRLAGDAVLRVTARRLSSVMRPTDELVHLAGAEFAVVCNGAPTRDQMVMIAERLIEQLSRPLSIGQGVTADVGVSIGMALGFPSGTPVDELRRHADGAQEAARAKGRSQWVVATPEG